MDPVLSRAQERSMDWRAVIASNHHKTFFIIGSFITIYVLLGLCFDLYLRGGFVDQSTVPVLKALLTFQVTPIVTLITGAIAVLSVLTTFLLHDRLILLGTEYHEIRPNMATTEEQQLYHVVEELKIAAGLRYMPKVYVINANYMNAFASGYSEKSALIAITKGLLLKLDRAELSAVIAHELSHIRHSDIQLTLMASVLSNLMLLTLDIFFYRVIISHSDRKNHNQIVLILVLLRYLLPFITLLLILYLSRTREYLADAGAVELTRDNLPLARALLKISQDHQNNRKYYRSAYSAHEHEEIRRSAYIFDPASAGLQVLQSITSLFSTHPSIDARLKALGIEIEKEKA